MEETSEKLGVFEVNEGEVIIKEQRRRNFSSDHIWLDENYNVCSSSDCIKYDIVICSYDCTEFRLLSTFPIYQIKLFLKGSSDFYVENAKITFPSNLTPAIISALRNFGGIVNDDQLEITEDPKLKLKETDIPKASDIREMIAQVDIKTFKNIIKTRLSYDLRWMDDEDDADYTIEDVNEQITNEVCRKYLKEWAKSKYHWYRLLGRKLKIEEEREIEKDSTYFRQKASDLMDEFPFYKYYINSISLDCLKENKLLKGRFPEEWAGDKRIKEGMKFTKLMALHNNNDLNMEISKMYQEKGTQKLVISIDPVDFLTTSINKSGWRSCHNFFDGEWRHATLAYMFDSSSAVAYVYDKEVEYMEKFRFTTNSKKWRQMIYWDGKNSATVFSRQYPYDSDTISDRIRAIFEENYCKLHEGLNNNWFKYSSCERANMIVEDDGYVYNDIENGFGHKAIINKQDKDINKTNEIHIGVSKYNNIITGKEHEDDSGHSIW
jgi:hypothetical protein